MPDNEIKQNSINNDDIGGSAENPNGKAKKKGRFVFNYERANPAHVILIVLVGGYIGYMAYMMYKNYRDGKTSMSLQTTVIVMCVMIAVALAVMGYALYVYLQIRKRDEAANAEEAEKKPETAQSPPERGYISQFANMNTAQIAKADSPQDGRGEGEAG